jgi:hypothetical protein
MHFNYNKVRPISQKTIFIYEVLSNKNKGSRKAPILPYEMQL